MAVVVVIEMNGMGALMKLRGERNERGQQIALVYCPVSLGSLSLASLPGCIRTKE